MCLLVIGITSVVLSKGASKKGEEDTGEESEKMMTEEKDENGVHGLELEMSSPLHDIKRMDDIYNDHNKSSDSSISDDDDGSNTRSFISLFNDITNNTVPLFDWRGMVLMDKIIHDSI